MNRNPQKVNKGGLIGFAKGGLVTSAGLHDEHLNLTGTLDDHLSNYQQCQLCGQNY